MAVSSLVDTWLLVRNLESNGERSRGLYVLKSRGMAHSNQVREFVITSHGVSLLEPYIGPEGVLTGSARVLQESREAHEKREREQGMLKLRELMARKQALLEQRVAELHAEFDAEHAELTAKLSAAELGEQERLASRSGLSQWRGGSEPTPKSAARARKS